MIINSPAVKISQTHVDLSWTAWPAGQEGQLPANDFKDPVLAFSCKKSHCVYVAS